MKSVIYKNEPNTMAAERHLLRERISKMGEMEHVDVQDVAARGPARLVFAVRFGADVIAEKVAQQVRNLPGIEWARAYPPLGIES